MQGGGEVRWPGSIRRRRQGRPFRGAEADPHGPLDGGGSAVAVHQQGPVRVVAQKQISTGFVQKTIEIPQLQHVDKLPPSQSWR